MTRDACQRVYVREQDGVIALQIPFVHYDWHFDMFIADFSRDLNGRRWWLLMVNYQLLDLNKLTAENYPALRDAQRAPGYGESALHLLSGGFNVNMAANSLDYDLEWLHDGTFFDLDQTLAFKSGDSWHRHIYLTFLRVWPQGLILHPELLRAEHNPDVPMFDPDSDEIPL